MQDSYAICLIEDDEGTPVGPLFVRQNKAGDWVLTPRPGRARFFDTLEFAEEALARYCPEDLRPHYTIVRILYHDGVALVAFVE